MTKGNPRPPQPAREDDMRELLIDAEKEPVPPRLRELAHRLDAALAAAQSRRAD